METVELHADVRSTAGKGPARRLRRSGKVPAVLYGPKRPATSILVDDKEFVTKVSALEGSHLIRFRSESSDVADRVALVKDTQFHPVTGAVVHADFYEVDLSVKLRVRVPLHFTGKAIGLVQGGILQPIVRDLEVECLPMYIPEFVQVDVTPLDIHDVLHVSQLHPPAGVTFLYDSDFALVTVSPPTVEEVRGAEAPAAEAVGAIAEVGKTESEK